MVIKVENELIWVICVEGEIPHLNELFMGKFQMTDAKTWGNVVGTEMQVIIEEILMIFVQGEIPH